MSDWWFIAFTFATGFVVGALAGYRRGVLAGMKTQAALLQIGKQEGEGK
jgi:hypothetical protein